jgi:hypothetical protein
MQQSLAAVVMLAVPGRISDVALYVKVQTPSKTRTNLAPAVTVPKELIVAAPVMCKKLPVAELRSTVDDAAKALPSAS